MMRHAGTRTALLASACLTALTLAPGVNAAPQPTKAAAASPATAGSSAVNGRMAYVDLGGNRAAGTQLWIMGPGGGHKHLLLSGLSGSRFPSWSPNGRRIVLAADAAHGTRQLFVLDLRTHHVRRPTSPPGPPAEAESPSSGTTHAAGPSSTPSASTAPACAG